MLSLDLLVLSVFSLFTLLAMLLIETEGWLGLLGWSSGLLANIQLSFKAVSKVLVLRFLMGLNNIRRFLSKRWNRRVLLIFICVFLHSWVLTILISSSVVLVVEGIVLFNAALTSSLLSILWLPLSSPNSCWSISQVIGVSSIFLFFWNASVSFVLIGAHRFTTVLTLTRLIYTWCSTASICTSESFFESESGNEVISFII